MLDIAILVVTYIMLGWGLNIVVGLAGLLDLGYVAFYAVGAYSYALLYDLCRQEVEQHVPRGIGEIVGGEIFLAHAPSYNFV